MTIGKKILSTVSVLIFCVLGVQAFISTHMVGSELERSVRANMTSKAQAAVDSFEGLLQEAGADLTVIGAHKAIENYLTFRVFGDEEAMTESVSELELFLARVFRAKPKYLHMQFANRDAVVLHMANGERVEDYETFDSAEVFAHLEKAVAAGEPAIRHVVRKQDENVMLLSVGAVVVEDKVEGLVWLYQPLDSALQALFAGAAENGLYAVISNDAGEIVAKSTGLADAKAQALVGGTLTGWVSIAQELPALNWRMTFGAEESTAFAVVRKLTMISGMVFVAALLIAAVVLVFLVRTIVRPLRKVVDVVETIAGGDLTGEIAISSKDEIAQLLETMQKMQTRLTEVIGTIKTGAETVSESAEAISQGNTDLSQRTEEQASSLQETASSMEEMTATVTQNADSAGQANTLASRAREQAEKGGQVVSKAVAVMGEINTASKKIADIISVIDEIAFQTNLLALNAAVEAARAGEQGRGFAVVASEVRNLAQRSATAAKEIAALIKDSVEKVDEGSQAVNESGSTLQEIVNSVKAVSEIIAEITAASNEQSVGIQQVSKAIAQLDQVTQQNAMLVEQATTASHSLHYQARDMKELVGFFKVNAVTGEMQESARPWAYLAQSQALEAFEENASEESTTEAENTDHKDGVATS
jgi:methyl-accepting chemotaxis protein